MGMLRRLRRNTDANRRAPRWSRRFRAGNVSVGGLRVPTYVEGEPDAPLTATGRRAWWIAGAVILLLFLTLALLMLVEG